MDVLFERPGRYPGQLVGRSPYLQPVQVTAPSSLLGTIAPVAVTEVSSNSLFGVLVSKHEHQQQQPALLGAGA